MPADRFAGHATLWEKNFRHRDVSPANLMYYRDPDGCVVGVLNDWDLATVVCDPTTPSTDRTSTIPFMALRLLTGDDVEHQYRHEAESFIWACIWVCACADGKAEMLVKPYATWRTLGMAQCAVSRKAFLMDIKKFIANEHHHSNTLLCIFLLSWLHEVHLHQWLEPANAETEREDIKVFRKLVNELDAIQKILESAPQTPERGPFRYITGYARKFIADNYPGDGTALLQDGVQGGMEGDENTMLRKEIDALRAEVEALRIKAV
jgi:Fungal protein kinase